MAPVAATKHILPQSTFYSQAPIEQGGGIVAVLAEEKNSSDCRDSFQTVLHAKRREVPKHENPAIIRVIRAIRGLFLNGIKRGRS